jgi:hypothetical protein
MKAGSRVLVIVTVMTVGHFLAGGAAGQTPGPEPPGQFNCSPAPCVLPPTQASEGGGIVTDSPIVTNALNATQLLLGSVDANCYGLGFHLSSDGGSTWKVTCMASIYKGGVWSPSDEPQVGYDRKGAAYIAGLYYPSEGRGSFVAFQKSTNGTHWSKPAVALRVHGAAPAYTWLTVDTNVGSHRVNSLYISGVMELAHGNTQVLVSHSNDGGVTWTQAAVDPIQVYPEEDDFTRLVAGKDGTVYTTWMHCRGKKGGDGSGLCRTAHMMFSKSTDGGNTWSQAQQIVTVGMPHYWWLPNTNPGIGVDNFPVIGVDNSEGAHAGNLYVAMYTWTGTYLRVQMIRSTDGGTTWSQPIPLAPKSDTHDQFFPSISVSSTGKVGVSWLDRRNDPNNIDYQAFAAISTDGGQSFGANWQLTTAFSNPDVNGDYNWMGDYTGNTWKGDNVFVAAWMDSSNGQDMQEEVGGVRLK